MSSDGTKSRDTWGWILLAGVVIVGLVIFVPVFLPFQQVRVGGTPRPPSIQKPRQIVLAFHNYVSQHNETLPPVATCDKDENLLLSWRVLILPYLEEADLFKQFNLDETWDGPNNIKLLHRMPKVYAPVRRTTPEPFCTFYQVFVGKGAAFEGTKGIPFADFTDGLSNTILLAEAEVAVPWTKPEDLLYSAKMPVPPLGGAFPDGLSIGMGDGSVRYISRKVREGTLRALITRNGQDEAGDDW